MTNRTRGRLFRSMHPLSVACCRFVLLAIQRSSVDQQFPDAARVRLGAHSQHGIRALEWVKGKLLKSSAGNQGACTIPRTACATAERAAANGGVK